MRTALYGMLLSVAVIACAAPKKPSVQDVPAPLPGEMPAQTTEHGVTVAADPYVQADRQERVFGSKPGRMGVLPVQMLIANATARNLLIRPYEIALLLPDRRALAPVGASQAAARAMGAPVQFSALGRSAAYSAPLAGAYGGPEAYGAVSGVSALAAIVLGVELVEERELHRQLFRDYRAKELAEAIVPAHGSRYGFVYFILPEDTPFPAEMKLLVRLIDTVEATASVVEIALPGVDLGESSRGQSERESSGAPERTP